MNYFYTKHEIEHSDIESVVKSLSQKILSQGKYKKKLETYIKNKFKVKYCLAVSSCTAALHLAYLVLGLKKKDLVVTSSLTWSAAASTAIHCGAKVKTIDIDINTLNMDLNLFESYLKKTNIKPKIVCPVHYGGSPIDLRRLKHICSKYNVKILEDAAHAMGSKYNNEYLGNCKYSDITVFSMQPAKPITSGEGGLLLTNNKVLFEKASALSKHCAVKNIKYPWTQDILYPGYNYKISEINCALGYSQIKKLDKFNKKREKLKNFYIAKLSKVPGINFQKILKNCKTSNHLFTVLLPKNTSHNKKLKIFKKLKNIGIHLTLKYLPLEMTKAYKDSEKKFSKEFFNRAFNFPMFYSLNESDIKKICKKFINIYKKTV